MQLSDKALDELRAIFRQKLEQEITRDEASEIGTRLIRLVRLLLRPLPGDARPADPPDL